MSNAQIKSDCCASLWADFYLNSPFHCVFSPLPFSYNHQNQSVFLRCSKLFSLTHFDRNPPLGMRFQWKLISDSSQTVDFSPSFFNQWYSHRSLQPHSQSSIHHQFAKIVVFVCGAPPLTRLVRDFNSHVKFVHDAHHRSDAEFS